MVLSEILVAGFSSGVIYISTVGDAAIKKEARAGHTTRHRVCLLSRRLVLIQKPVAWFLIKNQAPTLCVSFSRLFSAFFQSSGFLAKTSQISKRPAGWANKQNLLV